VTLDRAENAGRYLTAQAATTSSEYTGAGGIRLFRRSWRPTGTVRAVVANIHGLGTTPDSPALVDHPGGARHLGPRADLRGNGRSPGQRAYISPLGGVPQDLGRFLAVVREEGRPSCICSATASAG
jgi:alpha-beta hydrolase superfamily lysophospholipase